MKKLVCELCGSNNFTKDDDFFTCDYCRTKYTPAQAKSIMVEGTVSVNRSSEASNLGMLANLAIENRDYQLALNYANRVLEIDGQNSLGWLCRASAIGWVSTTDNLRIEEMISGLESAVEFASEDIKSDIRFRCASVLYDVCEALMMQTLKQTLWSAMDPWRWDAYRHRCLALIRGFHKANSWEPGRPPLNNILTIGSRLITGVSYPSGGTTAMGKPKTSLRRLDPSAEQELRAYLDAIRLEIQTL